MADDDPKIDRTATALNTIMVLPFCCFLANLLMALQVIIMMIHKVLCFV